MMEYNPKEVGNMLLKLPEYHHYKINMLAKGDKRYTINISKIARDFKIVYSSKQTACKVKKNLSTCNRLHKSTNSRVFRSIDHPFNISSIFANRPLNNIGFRSI